MDGARIIATDNRVPRASGDEPVDEMKILFADVVFPARAGMNRSTGRAPWARRCVPRASGDEPSFPGGSLTRATVFPARAGMNRLL